MRTKILAFVMAGGKGTRLEPLTAARSKPAVPFGGKYRIIDFVLSNLVNSGIYATYVLTQFKSQSLTDHLQSTWIFGSVLADHFITAVPAQQRTGEHWYQGTADAVFQNFNLMRDHKPELVAIFGGDHIYKMNVQDMIVFHGAKKADLSIAAIPVPLHEANQFGIIQVDEDWRITGFQEKPEKPTPIPGNPDMALASMGNYIFTSGILLDALQKDSSALGSSHDFGKNILPSLLANGNRLYAYDFRRNRIPGSNYEYNDSYWRDVGNLDSFYEASMDLRAVQPQLDLYNQEWPIRGAPNTYPPAKFVHNADGRVGHALQSIVCEGTIISGATVTDSVIGRRCRINSFSEVHQCVLNDGVEVARGARLRRCIIDKGAKIPANDVIGYNPEEDKKRFMMTESGIIVIAKDQIIHTV